MSAWGFYTSTDAAIATPSRAPHFDLSAGRNRNVIAATTLGKQVRSETRGPDQRTLALDWKVRTISEVRLLDALFAQYGSAAATFRVEIPDGALPGVLGSAHVPVRWTDGNLQAKSRGAGFWDVSMSLVEDVTSLLTSGTVTLANTRLSLVSGTSFVDLTGVSLSTYGTGVKYLIMTDSAGRRLGGWLKAAGGGVSYSSELLTNPNFDSATAPWTGTNCTLASVAGGQSGNCLEVTRTGDVYQNAVQTIAAQSVGMLYAMSAYVKDGSATSVPVGIGYYDTLSGWHNEFWSGTSTGSWVQITASITPPAGYALGSFWLSKQSNAAGTLLWDTASVKQVLTPSATGSTIVSTRSGSTYAWAFEETGFNRNDSGGYKYAVYDY